jgi:hypothetical protein
MQPESRKWRAGSRNGGDAEHVEQGKHPFSIVPSTDVEIH